MINTKVFVIAKFGLTGECPRADVALCNLLFSTSAGAHTVVATVPATREAIMCVGMPSDSFNVLFESSLPFAEVYLAAISMNSSGPDITSPVHCNLRNIC